MRIKSFPIAAALCVVLLSGAAAPAQDTASACYTITSLKGSYGIIGDYGPHLAIALSRGYFDGKGNFNATFVVNEPTAGSTTGARTLVTGSQVGTYTVNCDGTGVITRVVTLSSGTTQTVVSDFIITRAVHTHSENEVLIATGLVDAQRTPSFIVPGGVFLTRTYTRLPDADEDADKK